MTKLKNFCLCRSWRANRRGDVSRESGSERESRRGTDSDDGVVALGQDAVAVALGDDGERLGRVQDQRRVVLGGQEVEQLREERKAELVVANEQSAAELRERTTRSA